MALHDTLKDARNRVGMSQELVAEQLGISRQAVTKWELGQPNPVWQGGRSQFNSSSQFN